jgi:hypothetical protein
MAISFRRCYIITYFPFVKPALPKQGIEFSTYCQKTSLHGARYYEYKRHGVVSPLVAIDLLTGHVHMDVQDKQRSAEFIQFLKQMEEFYSPDIEIRTILDSHSSHMLCD